MIESKLRSALYAMSRDDLVDAYVFQEAAYASEHAMVVELQRRAGLPPPISMVPDQRLVAIAALVSNCLYLTGCFVASLFVQHGHAWIVALLAMGGCGVSYTMQLVPAAKTANALVSVATWALGIWAGTMIIQGI